MVSVDKIRLVLVVRLWRLLVVHLRVMFIHDGERCVRGGYLVPKGRRKKSLPRRQMKMMISCEAIGQEVDSRRFPVRRKIDKREK